MASTMLGRVSTGGGLALALTVLGGCPGDDSTPPNMLPTASASGTQGEEDSGTTMPSPDTDPSADDTETGGGASFPATYRFDCIDIITMGDSDGDGVADGNAIQATLLENTWASDIANHKLNILLTVQERDEANKSATIGIGSGIGTSNSDQCVEPSTASVDHQAEFDAESALWQPGGADGACVEAAAGSGFGGTYDFSLGASDTIYIYAEDDDGTVFNCVPGGGGPNAVPLHAIQASVTVDANDQMAGGQLTGCLVDSEAQGLCSCLGECTGAANPECGGCPDGATPLATLLGGVMPTDNCTNIMGETAYDLTVGFTNVRLAEVPATCG